MKETILISACLLGQKTRYDGTAKEVKALWNLTKYYDVIPLCPEVSGGLKIPRQPGEIKDGKVYTQRGRDITDFYHDGAYLAKTICRLKHIKLAILKENSPSCGVHQIYDGTFTGKKIPGYGIMTEALTKMGVTCLNEKEGLALLEKREAAAKEK